MRLEITELSPLQVHNRQDFRRRDLIPEWGTLKLVWRGQPDQPTLKEIVVMNLEWNGQRSFELYRLLSRLLDQCGPSANKHDQVTVCIDACIIEGANTRPLIVASIRAHGFNPRHVAIILNNSTGEDPKRFRWWLDDDGQYRLHNEP